MGAADEVFRRIASWYGRCHAVPEAARRTVRAPAVEHRAADWGFRTRDVRLDGDWWNHDLGPLVGYREDDGRPVALLPNGRGYRMFCPERGETARMDRCDAPVLRCGATMLYRTLGEDDPGWSGLCRFAAGGGVRDLRLVLASGVGTALVSLLLPVLVGLALGLAPGGRVGLAVELGGAALAVGAVSVAGAFARALIVLRLEGRAGLAVQAAMWGRLLATPGSVVSEWGTARLGKALLGADELRERLVRNGTALFTAALGGCCQLLLLFVVDVGIGIAASCVLALSCGACAAFARRQRASQRRLFELDQRLGALTGRLLGGIAKLRAAHAEDRAFDRWHEVFVHREVASSAARRMSGLGAGAPVAGYALGLVSILATGIVRVPHEAGAVAQIVCLSTLVALAHFVREGAAAITDIVRVSPQFEDVLRILHASTEPGTSRSDVDAMRGSVRLEDVSFRYGTASALVLDRVSFEVGPGEFVAVVGRSGSGKSTLVRLLLGVERPETGVIAYDGHDLAELDATSVRAHCGVVLQDSPVLAGDIASSITGGGDHSLDDAWWAAARVGLDSEISAMPMGMRTVLADGASALSEGQRQRVALARALLGDPRLLVLDEATSALDDRSQQLVEDTIGNHSATRIVVTRRLSTLRRADRVVVLDNGRVVEQGSCERLLRDERGALTHLAWGEG